ncbi:MAG TPA: hypothetical protein VLX30_00805 [Burkholderiales bacterium]|nr:hypothetical protein [Burkholderiales bacterium]
MSTVMPAPFEIIGNASVEAPAAAAAPAFKKLRRLGLPTFASVGVTRRDVLAVFCIASSSLVDAPIGVDGAGLQTYRLRLSVF